MGFLAEMWGSNQAANATEDASRRASNTQMQMFDRAVELQEPWRQAGTGALGYLQNLLGMGGNEAAQEGFDTFRDSTGYQFRLGEGMKGIERSAAARGGLNSGATLKALDRYGQDYASNEFGNYMGYLNSLAGTGQNTATNIAGQGINTGNQVAGNQMFAGQGRASAYGQMGRSLGQGIDSGIGYFFG